MLQVDKNGGLPVAETRDTEAERVPLALGALLAEHKGGDVAVLDLREFNLWTDFFVIATVSSQAHLSGLERHVKEYCFEQGIEIRRRSRRPGNSEQADEWCLIDLGTVAVHLMSGKARLFYELERLWSGASLIYSSNSS